MTRKHFKAIATIISNIDEQENERFQADKFLVACGIVNK